MSLLLDGRSGDIFDWLFVFCVGRQPEGKGAALLQFAGHRNLAIVGIGKPLCNAETKTAAP